jgi:hypothetical protein
VLAVSVDASGECIAVLVGVRVSRRDPCTKPAILAEREDLGSPPCGDLHGPVRRSVVDEEHVDGRQPRQQLVEDIGKVFFLVPGGDEDDGVGHGADILGGMIGTASRRARGLGGRSPPSPRLSPLSP